MEPTARPTENWTWTEWFWRVYTF